MDTHEKIRLLRQDKHWSREQMAKKLNMSTSGYAKIENGITQVNLERLQQIAQIFDIQLAKLLPDTGSSNVCWHNEGSLQQGYAFYNGNQEVILNMEKLNVQLQAAHNLLAEKDARIALLEKQLAVLQTLVTDKPVIESKSEGEMKTW